MLSEKSIRELRQVLEPSRVLTDPDELLVYEIDAAQDRGAPDGVAFPLSADEVAGLARWSRLHGIPLISRGAGTGLSGGAVAEHGGLIVEFSRLNRILELDAASRGALLEPGVITQTFDERTQALGLYYPPDPSSGRASTLGGNVGENAGGPHCFKYGVTTNYITGLEVVLADGSRLRLGGRALDYPEYDFNSLLVGSEGTLGLVTQIYTRLLCKPAGVKTLMAAFDSVEQAGRAVSAVIAAGLIPATLELMDQKIARIVEDFAHPGIPTQAGALLIVEVDGYPASLAPQMEEIAASIREHGGFDLRIAQTAAERDRIWYARKSAAGAMARLAPAYLLLDGTVPRSRLAEILESTNRICDEHELRVGYVLHAGDGNLHPFILMYPSDPDQVRRVWKAGREFMEKVTQLGGSITGEHGVGIEKRPYLSLMYGPAEISAMLDVKQVFDPDGRLNPGKIFPAVDPQAATTGEALSAPPTGEWQPGSPAEAAAGLAALSRERTPVWISGGSPRPDRPERLGSVLLNTCRLAGLRDLAPSDLYVTAGAGMKLDELQAVLASHGSWLPASSPYPTATLGGLLSANLNAPLRMRYGGLRDQVLAMTLALADGRVVRVGRPVVKNVAGYDLAKLMVGAFGTLGLIAEVTFKFTALPRRRASLIFPVDRPEQGLAWAGCCLPLARVASAVVLAKDLAPETGAYALVYTAEGMPQDVEAELSLVRQALSQENAPEPLEREGLSGTDHWKSLLGSPPPGSLLLRGAVPANRTADFVRSQQAELQAGPVLVDVANGMLYAALPGQDAGRGRAAIESLRQAALAREGYLVVLEGPQALAGVLDPWGFAPDTLDLMKRIKARWDPYGILNRGSFIV